MWNCVSLALLSGCGSAAQRSSQSGSNTGTPLVLIARLHALPGQGHALADLSTAVDKKAEAGEPGMLLHTFDQDPKDPLAFVWTELCASSDALNDPLNNFDLGAYLTSAGAMTETFTVALLGTISPPARSQRPMLWASLSSTSKPESSGVLTTVLA